MELGVGEILVILVILLLLFGPTKLPQLGDSLGRGIRNFKKAVGGHEEERPPGRAATPPREPAALPEATAPRPQAEAASRDEATSPVRK